VTNSGGRLSRRRRQALRKLKRILAGAGVDEWLGLRSAGPPDVSSIAEPLRTLVSLFALGQPVERSRIELYLPPEVISTLEALGLMERNGEMVTAGEHRLVSHLGLFLFCHKISAAAKLYYGDDSLVFSRLLLPAHGRVLDLCAGVGAQALVCAETAESVTAVDVEPLARRVFWINAAMNGLGPRIEYLIGDLFEPVAGRQFDRICSNPPFMPVPPGIGYPVYADGGPDGLAFVRRVLAGLPEALAPDGWCHIVGAVRGDSRGPNLSCFEELAERNHLGMKITCPSREALDESMLASCTKTTMACAAGSNVEEVFRAHFDRLGATHIYYFLLTAAHAAQPSVYFEHEEVQRATVALGPRSANYPPNVLQ